MGYIRHENVEALLANEIASGNLTPASLTEGVSRSFFNARLGYDALEIGDSWTVDGVIGERYAVLFLVDCP